MSAKLVLDEADKQRRFSNYKNFKSKKTDDMSDLKEYLSKTKHTICEITESESDSLTESDEEMDVQENVVVNKSNILMDLAYHESILDPETGIVRDNVGDQTMMIQAPNNSSKSCMSQNNNLNVIKSVTLKPLNQRVQDRKSVIVRNDKPQIIPESSQNAFIEIEFESLEEDTSDRKYSTVRFCIDLMEIEDMYTAEETLYFSDLLAQFKQISKVSFGEDVMNDYIQICKSVSHPKLRMVPQTLKALHQFLNTMESCNK